MNFIKKATKSFMAGFDHKNPKRHLNLKCVFDSETNAEGELKPVFDMVRLERDNFKFENVVNIIENYRQKELYNSIGERLYVALTILLTCDIGDMDAEQGEKTLLAFHDWANRNPQCPYASIALAEALNQVAWIHRGGGYANTVSEKGWQKFQEFSALSKNVLRHAQGQHANHWYWNYVSLRNVTEDQASIQEILNRYDRVARYLPHSPSVYTATVRPLLPRWGGNFELLEKFADQCGRETAHKLGDGAYSYVYSEIIDYGEDVRDLHIDRERFSKGCKDWLSVLPSDYLATALSSHAFLLADHNLCLDLLESLDVFYENAYDIEEALTFVNSVCRDETGR